MTPTTLDFLGNCTDAVDACPYVIDQGTNANGSNARTVLYEPGAAEALTDNVSLGTHPTSCVSYPSNVLSYDMT